MSPRALLLAAAFAALPGAAAIAAPIDDLKAFCLSEGVGETACDCYQGFVSENFSEREIEGAAVIAADPEVTAAKTEFEGMSIGMSKLQAKGFTSEEIQAALLKVADLEPKAKAACAAPAESATTQAPADGETPATPTE